MVESTVPPPTKDYPAPSFDEDDDDEEEHEDPNLHQVKSWDEGGPSDCGYDQSIHDTLMSIGGSVHRVVGAPTEPVQSGMGAIGNWFQEASYAIRDIFRGEKISGDAHEAFNTLVTGGEEDEEEKSHGEEPKTKPVESQL